MPMSAVYATVNGVLVEESRGGSVSCYVPDTLGSVTSRTEYWPYGEVRTQTGTNPSPWGFCGTWGYLRDAASRLYVRARVYRPREGRWNTLDPLWPEERAYAYVENSAVQRIDPSGLRASCVCKPRVRAVNVPCPKCLLFPIPEAGWPIGKLPPTRQECYDFECGLYCREEAALDRFDSMCDSPVEAAFTNGRLPPCTRGNPYHEECHHWCAVTVWGSGCSASHDPPQPHGGSFCRQECNKRACCAKAAGLSGARRHRDAGFKRCDKNYRHR